MICYFHEEWPDEFKTSEEALKCAVAEFPPSVIAALADEAEKLLAADLGEEELTKVLYEDLSCGVQTESEGMDARQWLTSVARILREG